MQARQSTQKLVKFDARGWVTPDAFNVTPDLLGVPLAKPSRRAMAMGLDVLVIVLLSGFASLWLLLAIAAVLFQIRKKSTQQSRQRQVWLWSALLLLVTIGSFQMVEYLEEHYQAKLDNTSKASDEEHARPALLAATAMSGSESNSPPDNDTETLPEESDAARIATLEHELALARMPTALKWREELMNKLRSMGLGFGWAIAYFSLLPYLWNGQSLGKRVFGLRVVELTGKPLSVFHCFSRYGGYAAGTATGGIGFLQILWDVNRQAIQDKIAHTVVIDLNQPRRLDLLEENLNQPNQLKANAAAQESTAD
jgi:uncharacterized RDD family membrane protein YckC